MTWYHTVLALYIGVRRLLIIILGLLILSEKVVNLIINVELSARVLCICINVSPELHSHILNL